MTIEFKTIPSNYRLPGQFMEIRPGEVTAGASVVPPKILLIGQKLAAGTAAAGVAVRVYSSDEVGSLAGRGSHLHQIAIKSFKAAPFVPHYIVPLADAVGTKSARQVTIAGTATAAGFLYVYVGDKLYQVTVASGATAAALATALAAAIQADVDRYVDAAVDGGTPTQVNLTARNSGVDAGVIPATINRYDSTQTTPAGITVTIGNLTAGTVNPSLATAITNLGDEWYPTVVAPYTDSTNLDLLKTEMVDRWGALRQIDGNVFTYQLDTVSNSVSFATARNDYTLTPIDSADYLTPPFAVVASVAALDAAEPDPARPRQTLVLPGVLAKGRAGRRTNTERNTLVNGGISTCVINTDGTVAIEYLTTSYRTNTFGAPDTNYFDLENLRTVASLRYSARLRFKTKYPRHKLGQDGSIGENVMTPAACAAEYVGLYREWMEAGWVEGGAAQTGFASAIATEINGADPNAMDSLITPDLMNQYRQQRTLLQFKR